MRLPLPHAGFFVSCLKFLTANNNVPIFREPVVKTDKVHSLNKQKFLTSN